MILRRRDRATAVVSSMVSQEGSCHWVRAYDGYILRLGYKRIRSAGSS
jgi:hypothetical protein